MKLQEEQCEVSMRENVSDFVLLVPVSRIAVRLKWVVTHGVKMCLNNCTLTQGKFC